MAFGNYNCLFTALGDDVKGTPCDLGMPYLRTLVTLTLLNGTRFLFYNVASHRTMIVTILCHIELIEIVVTLTLYNDVRSKHELERSN